jgi:ankyrin
VIVDLIGLGSVKERAARDGANHLTEFRSIMPTGKGACGMKPITPRWKLALSTLALVLLSGCITTPEEKLRQAAANGNRLRVETFLGQGVNAQAADERGSTPLLLAAKNGHRDVVTLLLDQGASVNLARQDGVTPLFIAAQEGQRDVVALLLEKGADVNAQARIGGVTLLHVGAYRGDREIVTLLLQHGADKNVRMSSGERPVDLARTQGHQALIPLLEP